MPAFHFRRTLATFLGQVSFNRPRDAGSTRSELMMRMTASRSAVLVPAERGLSLKR
jgi:hypothetical protein